VDIALMALVGIVVAAGIAMGQSPPVHHPALQATTEQSSAGTALNPTKFASGACRVFPPTARNRYRTVFIDAGHGGIDPGALGTAPTGRQVEEADVTLPVALDAATLLRADGYFVVLSRVRATAVVKPSAADLTSTGELLTLKGEHDDVAARDACANLSRATILLGIYFDAGTSSTDAGSITAYDADRTFSAKSKKLAALLENDVVVKMNAHGWDIPDDGAVTDATLGGPAPTTTAARYHHLLLLGPASPGWAPDPSRMPGALIEPLFLTDPFEASIAASGPGQEAIAQGMAEAAEQYLGSISG
jgi:N-acetylmuramoyl-L-alanine amidase